jgi:hypothetical protein
MQHPNDHDRLVTQDVVEHVLTYTQGSAATEQFRTWPPDLRVFGKQCQPLVKGRCISILLVFTPTLERVEQDIREVALRFWCQNELHLCGNLRSRLLALLGALPRLLFELLEQSRRIGDTLTGGNLHKPYLKGIAKPQRPGRLLIVL